MDGLDKAASGAASPVDLHQLCIHLLEVGINELVDHLGGQVNPNVQNAVLIWAFFESILQVGFDSLDHVLCALEVMQVPLVVGLGPILLTD